jgi:aspartyl-tRNA synthetase
MHISWHSCLLTIDVQTQTNQAIFKIQSAISHLFREHLDVLGFVEIHTPKLQGAATESGASVFKVDYFKGSDRPLFVLPRCSFRLSVGNAFLAQSPQLAKQMAIAADFERVYEIGPVFRAELSFTHRHMTEFMGLDLEMTIEEHYHEVMETLDDLFKHIFSGLRAKYSKEIEVIRKAFPVGEFKWREGPEGTLKLTFREAVEMLVEDGVPRENLDDIE